MGLVRWRDRGELSPWSALRELESQFGRLFGEMTGASDWMLDPPVDITETPEAYILEADLPGVEKTNLEVTCVDNVVTLKGERRNVKKEEDGGCFRAERRYGRFERSFEIPGGFENDRVEAAFTDGVLRVTLPKREETKPKQISVKVG